MPYTTLVGELYRRSASVDSANSTRERVFRVWRQDDDTGQPVPLTATEAIDAVADQEGVTLGSEFPDHAALICDSINADESDGGDNEWHYEITYSYSIPSREEVPNDFNEFMQRSNGPGADSPTNPFGPERSGGGQVMDEYWAKDLDGKKFVMPTGVPFQNTPPIPITIQVDRITVNEATPGDTSRIGMCAGNTMLANVTYEELTHVNKQTGVRTKYYRNSYERWTHPDRPFSRIELLLYSFQAYYPIGDQGVLELRNCKENDNNPRSDPVTEPVPLDTAGRRKHGEPDTKTFRIRREGALQIPFMG